MDIRIIQSFKIQYQNLLSEKFLVKFKKTLKKGANFLNRDDFFIIVWIAVTKHTASNCFSEACF